MTAAVINVEHPGPAKWWLQTLGLKDKMGMKEADGPASRWGLEAKLLGGWCSDGEALGCTPLLSWVKNNFSCTGGKDGYDAGKNKGSERWSHAGNTPNQNLTETEKLELLPEL